MKRNLCEHAEVSFFVGKNVFLWYDGKKVFYTGGHRMHPVYFVRHGESEWNVADRICGQTDVALTDLGHAQAIATGQKIAKAGIAIDEIGRAHV